MAFAVAAVAGEGAREIEVGVGVVGRELERFAIVGDRVLDLAAVLVERPEIVGGLAAPRVLVERRKIRGAGLVVTAHAVQEQPQVVPRRGVGRIDRDDSAIRVDRVLHCAGSPSHSLARSNHVSA